MRPGQIAVLLILIHLPAQARIVGVNSFAALRSACVSALPGDTIAIAPGTYTISGYSRIMITGRPGPVLVRGATGNPADVIVQGQGQNNSAVQMVFNLDNSPGWTFRDLTTRNSYYHGFKFDHASTDCKLINVVMRDHGESGVKGTSDPASGTYPDRLLIDSCDIGFTVASGGTRSVVEGVDGVGVNDWIIRHSRFVNIQKGGNPAYAIFTKGNSSNTIIEGNRFENCFIGASFGGGGTGAQFFRDNDRTYEHRNGIIRNNIIMRCSDAGIYVNKGSNCRIYNNTVFECVLTIQLRFAGSTGYVRNNLVKRAASNPNEPVLRLRDGATTLANQANLSAGNADFVQPAGSYAQLDLHLLGSSNAVDAGVSLPGDVPVDFEGQPRPVGGVWDAGADELGYVPVELTLFSAVPRSGEVILRWRTEHETDNFGFEIQRSAGGQIFERIGFVAGRGNTETASEYRYSDIPPGEGLWRYRLRQLDFSGGEAYSPVQTIRVETVSRGMHIDAVSPQPAKDILDVHLRGRGEARLTIMDLLGRPLLRMRHHSGSSSSSVRMSLSGLSRGMYFLLLESESGTHTLPVIVAQHH